MPSPFAHMSVGFLLLAGLRRLRHTFRVRFVRDWIGLSVFCVFFSMLPDIDAAPGFWFGDLGKYHNNLTHSLFVCAVVALLVVCVSCLLHSGRAVRWGMLAGVCYGMHILMDWLSYGRGVMLLWPFTRTRYASPLHLFYGLRWSEGLWSLSHLWTLLNELAVLSLPLLALLLCCRWMRRSGRRVD
jgi:membrane-bound metal-dependent hydrolase YbcI (DUF457 family)